MEFALMNLEAAFKHSHEKKLSVSTNVVLYSLCYANLGGKPFRDVFIGKYVDLVKVYEKIDSDVQNRVIVEFTEYDGNKENFGTLGELPAWDLKDGEKDEIVNGVIKSMGDAGIYMSLDDTRSDAKEFVFKYEHVLDFVEAHKNVRQLKVDLKEMLYLDNGENMLGMWYADEQKCPDGCDFSGAPNGFYGKFFGRHCGKLPHPSVPDKFGFDLPSMKDPSYRRQVYDLGPVKEEVQLKTGAILDFLLKLKEKVKGRSDKLSIVLEYHVGKDFVPVEFLKKMRELSQTSKLTDTELEVVADAFDWSFQAHAGTFYLNYPE